MQKVIKFIANDGQEFNTAAEAKEHNRVLVAGAKADVIKAKLDEKAEELQAAGYEYDSGKYGFFEFLANNATVLRKVLNEVAVNPRGPRQPKAAE